MCDGWRMCQPARLLAFRAACGVQRSAGMQTRTCRTCGLALKRGYYHRHAAATWEVFDPRNGTPLAFAASETAAARLAPRASGLERPCRRRLGRCLPRRAARDGGRIILRITRGHGFHLTFANGWTAAVQFGDGNYHTGRFSGLSDEECGRRGSTDAEVAAFDPDHKLAPISECDTVAGWLDADAVARFIAKVAAMPAGTKACDWRRDG